MEEEGEKHKEEEAKPSEDLPSLLPVPSSQHDSGSKDQVHMMSKFFNSSPLFSHKNYTCKWMFKVSKKLNYSRSVCLRNGSTFSI